MKPFIQLWAESLGITEPVNGSWAQAIAEDFGVTEPVNGSWLQAIAYHLGQFQPVNGSWIQAIALAYGATDTVNENWIQAILGGSTPGGNWILDTGFWDDTANWDDDAVWDDGPLPPYDTDAQAFFDATGLSDSTEKEAVNDLVIDLKNAGLWSKMYAIYPFVGGTASTQKYNLKDPRDLDAAYRLNFIGGTNNAKNYQTDGIDDTANTFLKISDLGVTQSYAMGAWLVDTQDEGQGGVFGARGSGAAVGLNIQFTLDFGFGSGVAILEAGGGQLSDVFDPILDIRALNWFDRVNSNTVRLYRNTTLALSSNSYGAASESPINNNTFLGSLNQEEFYRQRYSFAFISDSIGDSNVTTFYNIVNDFVTALDKKS